MSFLVLRRKNGTIRLLLPTENSRVMRSTLQMYYPSRLLGYMYKFFKYVFLPLLSKFNLTEKVEGINDLCPHLDVVLKSLAFPDIKVVGVLVSDVGPRSKSTLKIMNLAGDELAYARIALLPNSRKVVDHETEVLKALIVQNVAGGFPRVLSSGKLENPEMSYSVQSVGPNKSSGSLLHLSHLNYLDSLAKPDVTNVVDVLKLLKLNLNSVVVDQRISTVIDRVFQALESVENFSIRHAIEHGDFTPWNIRKKSNGELFVFDWEHADLYGLVWMDVLHFTFQVETLVKRKAISEVTHELMLVFDHKILNNYSCLMPVFQREVIIVLYLLSSIITGHKEGLTSFEVYFLKIGMLDLMRKKVKQSLGTK